MTAPSGAQTPLSYSATPSTVCTVGPGSGALTIVGAGDCEVTVTAAVTADYEVATAMFTVAVAQGAQTLTGFRYSAASVTFGDTAPTVTAPSGAQTPLSYSATPSTVCTVGPGSGALTIVGAGDCEVTVTAAVTADYEVATAMFTVAVAQGAQTLTGFRYSAASVTFGDTAPTVTAPSGAQTPLSYSATPSTVCTVGPGSGALTIVGAGDCEVTVTAAVTADYEVATAMFTVAVAKGAQTLTGFRYSAASVTFGDTAPTVTAPSGAQTPLSYSATPSTVCTVGPGSGALTIVGAGDCEVTVTAAVTADYEVATAMFTVAVAKGAQTLTGFRYSAASVTFGDTAPTVTAPSGAQTPLSYSATPSTVCTVGPGSGALTIVGAGDCEVTVTAAVTADYEVATAMFTVAVAKGAQTLTGFRYSAASVTFGDTAPTVTAPSGAQTPLSYSATPSTVCTVGPGSGALTIVGAGDCEVTVTAAVTADYEVATAMFTVAVAKGAQTLTGFRYSAASVTFGDTAPTVTAPSGAQTPLSYSATPSTVCTVGPGSGALTIVGAGDCEVTVTAAVTADYEVATAMFTVAVAKGAQTLTGFRYSAASVTFGDTAPTVTAPSGAQTPLSYSATPLDGVHGRPRQRRVDDRGGGGLRGHGHGGGHGRLRGRHGDVHRGGGQGGSDADGVPLQCGLGDVRRYRADGDGALRGADPLELLGHALDGVHGRPRQRRVDDRGGGGLRGHGHGGGHGRLRGSHGDVHRGGGQGGSDADGVPLQCGLGDVRRYRADGDGAIRGADPLELLGHAARGVHGRPRQRRVDDRGGGGLRGHGHGGGHGRLRGATAMFTVAVAKGAQTLTGFRYSAASVTFGDTAPTVTAPIGAQTPLSYSATPSTVCTVGPGSGALTIVGAGDCEVTVTAAVTADYEVATAMFTVAVAKGAQTLTGFRYSAASVTFGDTAPTVTAPSGAQTPLSYSATPLAGVHGRPR